VRFCEWLPPRFRAGKRLPGHLLERHGYPAAVVHPAIPEDFGHVMQLALRRHVLGPLRHGLDDSVLVGLGLVDADAVRTLIDEPELPFLLYELANLDLALRSLLR
jgi:asparagine synthase (glutamine-hydrolysing)